MTGATETTEHIGLAIPGLRVLEYRGGGAHTAVYRVQREGRDYALKILRDAVIGENREEMARAFRREAAVLACIHHRALPEIYEVGQWDGRPYLMMELLDGRELAEVLRDGPLVEAELLAHAIEITDALAAAHRQGLVHRDVKPQNIIIVNGMAKLIDFGLAAHAGQTNDSDDVVAGTLLYSSPEQSGILSRPVDGRSDLYSLGAVIHQCATGSPPFEASDVGELLRMHAVVEPSALSSSRPDLAPGLSAIVARLLAKDPDDRYQQANGLLADLRGVADATAGHEDWMPGRHDHAAGGVEDMPLVGRDAELARLLEQWDGARSRLGAIALVEGHPGGGKSRLVREVMADVRADGGLVLRGKCVRGNPVPLAPLREALDEHVRSLVRLRDTEAAERTAHLRAAAGADAGLLAASWPSLAEALGVDPEPTERARHEQFPVVAAGFLAELARLWGGALLAIDDVQWLDDASRRVIRQLDQVVGSSPLLVLATSRDDEASRAACDRFRADAGRSLTCTITLRPLDDVAMAELVTMQLGGATIEDHVAEQILVRSDGNPFTAVEYLRAILDAGLLQPRWGTCFVDREGLDRLALPDDVLDLVVARARGLGDETRHVLVAAAAHGGAFRPGMLADVVGVDQAVAMRAMTDATTARLVEPDDLGARVFVHDRIREALISDLSSDELKTLHQSIAVCTDREEDRGPAHVYSAARHYALGTGATPVRECETNVAAGRAALEDYSGAEAAAFFAHAAAVAPAAGVRLDADFEAAFARALVADGRLPEAGEHLTAALELVQDPWAQARLLAERARLNQGLSMVDEAIDDVDRALAGVGQRLSPNPVLLIMGTIGGVLRAVACRFLGMGYGTARGEEREHYFTLLLLHDAGGQCAYVRMKTLPMLAHAFRSLYPANRVGPSPEYVELWSSLGLLAAVLKQRRIAGRITRRNRELADGFGDPQLIARTSLAAALTLDLLGDAVDASDGFVAVLDEQGRWLDGTDFREGGEFVSWNFSLRGYFTEAASWLERSFDLLKGTASSEQQLDDYLAVEMAAGASLGRATHSSARHAEAEARIRATGDAYFLLRYLTGMVSLHVERGEFGPPLDDTVDEFELARQSPARASQYIRHFWAQKAYGRIEQYRAAADEPHRKAAERAVRELGRAANIPLLRAHHRLAQASLAQIVGDHRRALRRLAQADRLATVVDAPLIRFGSLMVRARVLRAQDRDREACAEARFAMTIALEHGWAPRARAARAEFALADRFVATTGRAGAGSRSGTGTGVVGPSRERRHLRALLDVSVAASTVLEPRELAGVALDEIVRILNAERALLFLCQEGTDTLELLLGRNADGTDMPISTGYSTTLVERVRVTREALVITGTDEGAALGSESVVLHGLRSILVAPVQLEDRLLGVVYLDSRLAKGMFTEDDVDILVAIANHVAVSLETARAAQLEVTIQSERQRRALAEALRDALAEVTASLEPDQVLERLLLTAGRALPHDHACVLLNEPAGWRMIAGPTVPELEAPVTPEQATALEALMAASSPVVVPSCTAGIPPPLGLFPDVTSWMAVPLQVREEALGVLVIASTTAVHDQAQAEIASTFASQGMVAFENARLFAEVQRLATTDELTGLNNRRQFLDLAKLEVASAHRYTRELAVVMLDIDLFKRVNDTHGHAVGDTVLRDIAHRLQDGLRVMDVAGRVGGEEFAVVLRETGAGARDVAERLRAIVERDPVSTAVGDVWVTMSIGLTTLGSDDTGIETLLGRADSALYEAKAAGRNRVVVSGEPVAADHAAAVTTTENVSPST